MTNYISQAFGHPEQRAQATAADALLDRISLRNYVVEVEIGAFQAERGKTQRLAFNIVVEVTARAAPLEDDVDRILSYDRLTEAIAHELAAERLNLLETLAERIAGRILNQPQAQRVFVRIEKLDRGPGALGVEIMRLRDTELAAPARGLDLPVVIYIDPAEANSPNFGNFLDLVKAEKLPVVLATGLPKVPRPVGHNAEATRRIALLAFEQSAWSLAGHDTRLSVAGSRTELDWALKNQGLPVWAPQKIILDTVDMVAVSATDGPTLAAWLAGLLQARALIMVGAKPPQSCNIPAFTACLSDTALPKLP